MAQQEEPMEVDSSMCDFDNKENAYQHGNLLSRTPSTEKGYEELDVAELNMKLKYSTTPTGHMSKSYTVVNRTFDKFADNGNMTQSLHTTLPKSEKPKDLPLHNLTDHNENRSVLRPLDSTVTLDNDIKVTVSTPHEADEYISLPSSTSSLAQTPEATTPTKDIKDEGSPIMRGLKSVLNMFRPSQSPIPVDEDAIKSEVLSPPIVISPHAPDNNQSLVVSTPLAARKTDMLTKRTNPNKETVVFNEDLEKELLWKDESTILFDDEKVPLHKLFLQNAKTVVASKNIANSNENQKQADLHTGGIENSPETGLDSTVEYMDTTYADKTINAGQVESDSEFVDCETTFNKNETLFSAETSLDNIEFLDSTKDIVDKLSAIMVDKTVNISTNTLEASNMSVDLSNISTVTTQAKAENEENNTQENVNVEDHKENKTLEEVVKATTDQDYQPSVKDIMPEDELSFKNENQDLQDTVAAHVSISLTDSINDSPIISHPDKHVKNFNVPEVPEPHVKENKSQVIDNISQVAQLVQDNAIDQDNASITCKDDTESLVINTLSQIPLIADPRVLLFNISSEMAVEDVQVQNKTVLESIPSEIPLPSDDELSSLPVSLFINDKIENTTLQVDKDDIKIDEVTKDISVELDTKPENNANANTTMNVAKENLKRDESVAKDVSLGSESEPNQDQNTLLQVITEAGSVSNNDPNLEQTAEPSIEKVENLLNTTKVCTINTVISPPEMSLVPVTENILADIDMSKIAGEPNDLVTATVQQDNKVSLDQDLSVKNTDEVMESPKTEDVHTGDKEVISSHLILSDLENTAPNNNVSTFEETKLLTIDIPQSPRPENYVVPVSDLVIAGTVQESVGEIPQDLTTPNSNTREHIIKTIPGSFLTKLNDSIERRKSNETEIKQDNIETEIKDNKVETEIKQEMVETEIEQEMVETEIKQEMVETEIKKEMVETEIKQDMVETEIKQDKFGTVIAPSGVAESTQIVDTEIQSIMNDDEIFKTQPKNVDDLEPASKNMTESPIAVDISLQEDIHVNLPESKQTELKEINQNEINEIASPIDFVSNSAFAKDLDNSGKSDCHISVSGNDEFCKIDEMASVAEEVVTTPLDIECQLKSHPSDDSAKNQVCDSNNAPATDIIEQLEVVAATGLEASAINQDCDVSMMVLSPIKESEDKALVISAPPAEKEEGALVISTIPVEKEEDQPVVLASAVEKKANINQEIVVSENSSPFVSLTQNEVVPEPTVEINKKQVDLDLDNFEEIENPFSTSSNKITLLKSPPIASKGYNFNFDEIDDPFATKTKIRQSPSGDNDNSPNQTFSHMDDTLPVEEVPIPKKVNRRISQPPQRKPVRGNKKLNSTFAGSKTVDTKPKLLLKNDPKVSEKLDMPESSKAVEQPSQVIEEPYNEIKIQPQNENLCSSEAPLTSNDNINSKSLEQSTYYSAGTSSSDSVTKVNLPEFDDPNFNPFATKTKIQKSPPPSLNSTFESAKDVIVPEIDDPNFNPFATKTKIQKSPPPSLNGTFDTSTSSAAKTTSSDANDMIENFQKPLSPIPQEVAVKESLYDPNVTCLSKTSTMQSMQTVCSVNTEDQDTIEGPFLDEIELREDEKMDLDEEHGMFEFGELPPGNEENAEGEMFIDAEAFEFLLNQNQTNAIADSGKESLFLKFDPLFAKRASLGLSSRQCMQKRDVPMKPSPQNTPVATTLPDGTFEAIPIEKSTQQDITKQTPQKDTAIATTLLDSTFETIPENSQQNPLLATQQLDNTFEAIPSQDIKIQTPMRGIKSPLRGIKTPPHRDLRTPPRDYNFVSVPPFAETKLNKSADGDGTLEASTDELNVPIAKPTMVVSPAFNPVVTPRRATTPSRRSFTFTSPAIAVIDRLLSIGANNSGLGHDSMLRSPDNEADQALVQLRELLAEKEMSVQNLRTESKDLRERLGNLESQMKNLEAVSQERLKNINALNDKLNETLQENKSMARVFEEYERTIASLITETEQDKKRHAEERMQLISERDEATSHLSSMEISFSDLHSKYEKSKQIIFAYKANDEALKRTLKDFEEKLAKMESNYESLKQHATAKLNHANEELQKINRAHESEVLKMNAMMKRKEVDVASLEETLAQKIKTNQELASICDSLLAKFG